MPSFSNTWLPFIYLYAVGGLFFIIGMVLIKKAGGLNLSNKRYRYWRNILTFGFFYFLIIHVFLILAALYW